jgi:hypothetical protein
MGRTSGLTAAAEAVQKYRVARVKMLGYDFFPVPVVLFHFGIEVINVCCCISDLRLSTISCILSCFNLLLLAEKLPPVLRVDGVSYHASINPGEVRCLGGIYLVQLFAAGAQEI